MCVRLYCFIFFLRLYGSYQCLICILLILFVSYFSLLILLTVQFQVSSNVAFPLSTTSSNSIYEQQFSKLFGTNSFKHNAAYYSVVYIMRVISQITHSTNEIENRTSWKVINKKQKNQQHIVHTHHALNWDGDVKWVR